MNRSFDAIVIGAGQAGPSLAARLAKAGMTVAIAERHLLGGTCVNTGCTPTKTMVANAKVAHVVRDAARFGVHVGDVVISLAEVKSRADSVVQNSRDGLHKMLTELPGCTLLQGHARFVSPHEVQVGAEILKADRIFINVGNRAARPKLPGIETIDYLTNSTLLKLTDLPRHLIVVGGGAVGIEFAQIFRRFGSEVTLVERSSHLAQQEDSEASSAVATLLESESIHLRLNAQCISFSRQPQGVCVHVDCKAEEDGEVHGSHVLLAMGRVPNTDDLGLESAGVLRDSDGYIVVDDALCTNVPHIWALGDCNRRGAFTHTSYNDFEIVATNLLDGGTRRVTDRIPVHALYTDPPLAQVGMTEQQARDANAKILIAKREMSRVSRAVEKGEPFGFMKVIVSAETKRILGATIFGVGGDEAIHCILDVMYADASYTVLQHAVHIHPTVAELIPTLLGDLHPAL
jgi:pyruvate/2-oxoglutarate dehydrogenase complex dihydrolipoamide dehydrogenase (E3) component